jgi:8-oxo-dGTP diphosphatase
VMDMAIKRLQGKVIYAPVIFDLLPGKFRLNQLRKVYEIILERPIAADGFRKKILGTGMLTPLNEFDNSESGPPARLYRFDKKRYKKMLEDGFTFELKPDSPQKSSLKA